MFTELINPDNEVDFAGNSKYSNFQRLWSQLIVLICFGLLVMRKKVKLVICRAPEYGKIFNTIRPGGYKIFIMLS